MKKLLLLLLFALPLKAQTTVIVNFDNPLCKENTNPGTYQGIIFTTGSPWDCETNTYPGNSGLSLSWSSQRETNGIESGTFKFITPSILNSFKMATSMTNTSLMITTDAGESMTIAPSQSFAPYQTGFTKPATTITVYCSCGWTLEMDDITYTVPPPLPPPPLVVPVPGLGNVTFILQGITTDMTCSSSDNACAIRLKFCDTSLPQNCYEATTGILTVEKIVLGQPTKSTVVAVVGP